MRNLVLAYLDSELDARTSQEMQLHLETCAECAQLVEHEEKFNERLSGVLRVGQSTPALWEQIEARLRPSRGVAWFFPRWRAIAMGGIAALLVAGIVGGLSMFRAGASALDLAQAVEKDHRKFLEGKMPAQFSGALPDEFAGKLEGRLDAAAFLKLPRMEGFRSEGARLCHLGGVPVAWTLGRCQEVPVSWIVFKKGELGHFPKTQQRLETGEPVVCARTGRFQFAVRFAGDYVICAIANIAKETLEDLVKSVSGPG